MTLKIANFLLVHIALSSVMKTNNYYMKSFIFSTRYISHGCLFDKVKDPIQHRNSMHLKWIILDAKNALITFNHPLAIDHTSLCCNSDR